MHLTHISIFCILDRIWLVGLLFGCHYARWFFLLLISWQYY